MNKEHFLIELRLNLKQLPFEEQQDICQVYADLFDEQLTAGLSEFEISKELGQPKLIAIEILKSKNLYFEETQPSDHGWQEFSDAEQFEHPYQHEYEFSPVAPSRFSRVSQIIGLFFLNTCFMIWMISALFMLLFAAWLVALAMSASPLIALVGIFMTAASTYGFFQLASAFIFCGVGLIGFLLLKPITTGSFKLLKGYIHWNLLILRGGHR